MNNATISDGDLLAYLDGEHLPYIEQALQKSPTLRLQLEQLRLANTFFRETFEGLIVIDTQDLVDVATGQSNPEQELLVQAHLRRHPEARVEYELIRNEVADDLKPPKPKWWQLPVFRAVPMEMAGVRSRQTQPPQSFQVAGLDASLILHISPTIPEHWQIVGRILQRQQPIVKVQVTLRSDHSQPRPRFTNELGTFKFPKLRNGTYRLRVYLEHGVLYVPEIVLEDG